MLAGGEGLALFAAAYGPESPAWLRELPAVETLRRDWVQQFQLAEGATRWRRQVAKLRQVPSVLDPGSKLA